jgi:hypothetical protein
MFDFQMFEKKNPYVTSKKILSDKGSKQKTHG